MTSNNTGIHRVAVILGVMDPSFCNPADTTGITAAGQTALTCALAEAGYEIINGPVYVGAEPPPTRPAPILVEFTPDADVDTVGAGDRP